MENLIIFGAEKLIFLSPLLVVWVWYRSTPEVRRQIFILAGLSLPLTYISAVLARTLWFNPRPFVIQGFEPLIPHIADNGFPSDHMLLASALAVLISFFNKQWSVALWVIALLVGLSRVGAGVHHVTDILGSILIAGAIGWLTHFFLKRFNQV